MGYIKDGSAIFIKMKIRRRGAQDPSPSPKIESIRLLANVKANGLQSLEIIVPANVIDKQFRTDLIKLIKEHHTSARSEGAKTPVKMKIVEKEKGFSLDYDTKFLVEVDNALLKELEKMGVKYKGNVNLSLF